jgi:2-hydroxychromene-2-carboxylate isomerase
VPRAFSVTWDYRCPFARNAHEHLLAGLAGGADWDVTFTAFSLGQVHVEEGEPPVWDRPDEESGLYALRAGVAVRDRFPEAFPAVHRDLFAARHDHGLKIKDPTVVTDVLAHHFGAADVATIVDAVESGDALATVRKEHEAAAGGPGVWGVPTFYVDDRAVFVRLMDRNRGASDAERAHGRHTIDRVLDLFDDFVELNEYKFTSIPR